ncbi:MAG: hypothetical protein R2839_02255 [Thermomicrobiales bacterium]
MSGLRPETAQAMFVQYRNIVLTSRVKLPFGVAQIGKEPARNHPGNFIFRDIEFEQWKSNISSDPTMARGRSMSGWAPCRAGWT